VSADEIAQATDMARLKALIAAAIDRRPA